MNLYRITPPAGMTECDGCGGDGHNGQDEDGRFYSCYRCGESGWMPVECLDERPDPDDKHRPEGTPEHRYDPGAGCMAPVRAHEYPRATATQAASSGIDWSGDIPF